MLSSAHISPSSTLNPRSLRDLPRSKRRSPCLRSWSLPLQRHLQRGHSRSKSLRHTHICPSTKWSGSLCVPCRSASLRARSTKLREPPALRLSSHECLTMCRLVYSRVVSTPGASEVRPCATSLSITHRSCSHKRLVLCKSTFRHSGDCIVSYTQWHSSTETLKIHVYVGRPSCIL